jgi:tetratricopeptide (TPR) repeat protein
VIPGIQRAVFCVLVVAMSMTGAIADTITLKSGEAVEGKITKETDKDVTVEVKISASITDERVVLKSDIANVEKATPDVVAYRAIAAYRLGVDSMALAQYEAPIEALRAFVRQYPDSSRAVSVKTILHSFEDEQARVGRGEVKLNEKWLTKDEVEKEKIQIGARLALSYMMSQSAGGDYIGAMTTFNAIEKNFPGAAVMPNAIDFAKQVLPALKAAVQKALANAKAFRVDRSKRLAIDSPTDRKQVRGAIKQEQVEVNALVDAAEKAGNWPPLLADNEKSVNALLKHADREAARIAALPVDKMKQSVSFTYLAKQNLDTGDSKTAVENLKQATALWPENEMAQRLTKDTSGGQKADAGSAAAGASIPGK